MEHWWKDRQGAAEAGMIGEKLCLPQVSHVQGRNRTPSSVVICWRL